MGKPLYMFLGITGVGAVVVPFCFKSIREYIGLQEPESKSVLQWIKEHKFLSTILVAPLLYFGYQYGYNWYYGDGDEFYDSEEDCYYNRSGKKKWGGTRKKKKGGWGTIIAVLVIMSIIGIAAVVYILQLPKDGECEEDGDGEEIVGE